MAMKKGHPYYSVGTALERGMEFGGALGMIGAGIAMVVSPPALLMVPVFLMAGAAAGAGVFGGLFVAGNVVSRVPGVASLTGEDKAPPHLDARQKALVRGDYVNSVSPEESAELERRQNNRDGDFRDAETQRLMQNALQGQRS